MYFTQMDNKKFALLVANGEVPSQSLLQFLVAGAKLVVAADGGANILQKYHLLPNAVIGDFDSLTSENLEFFRQKNIEIINKRSQEKNDLEKGLLYLLERNFKQIIFTAVHGKRDDHYFAALQLMKKYKPQAEIIVYTDYTEIILLGPGRNLLKTEKGFNVSLFGFNRASGVITKNLKYSIKNDNLEAGSRGISNVAESNQVEINFEKGEMLVFRNLQKDG